MGQPKAQAELATPDHLDCHSQVRGRARSPSLMWLVPTVPLPWQGVEPSLLSMEVSSPASVSKEEQGQVLQGQGMVGLAQSSPWISIQMFPITPCGNTVHQYQHRPQLQGNHWHRFDPWPYLRPNVTITSVALQATKINMTQWQNGLSITVWSQLTDQIPSILPAFRGNKRY